MPDDISGATLGKRPGGRDDSGWSLAEGETLGGYRVVRPLGRGGMGEVYLVRHERMGKLYALKLVSPGRARDEEFRRRFALEARVMADLDHPNIVRVHYMGEDGERCFLVMDYIEGPGGEPQSLADLLAERKKLPEPDARRMALDVARALEYAHAFREGVIHRDLKPGNILIDAGGRARVSDFGLAKVMGDEYVKSVVGRGASISMSFARTNAPRGGDAGGLSQSDGAILGTFEYMAPEQEEGRADARSDVYSLGLVIYRMLTGERAKGAFAMPSELGCARAWDGLIKKALAPHADRRYPNVTALVADLGRTCARRGGPKVAAAVVAVGVLAAAGVGGAVLYRESARRERLRMEDARREAEQEAKRRAEDERRAAEEARRRANGAAAIASLRAYLGAQMTFRRSDHYILTMLVFANPRDGRGFPDLHRVVRPKEQDEQLDLIDRAFAEATGPGSPKSGYYFVDITGEGDRDYEYYEECGLCASPAQYGRSGIFTYAINTTGAVYRKDTGGVPVTRFPDADELPGWTLCDDGGVPAAPEPPSPSLEGDAGRAEFAGPRRYPIASPSYPDPTLTLDCGGGVTMNLVLIPAGEFMMGSRDSAQEVARKCTYSWAKSESFTHEHPQHRVRITKPFYMGKYEVMQAQYQAVMGTNASDFKGADLPVETVSWNDATEFCRKLSQKTGKQVRLPTEAEWEYACRAGTKTPFHFGETISTSQVNYNGNYPYAGGAKGTYREKTTTVGSFQPNAWGLHDMHGNVWEWCTNWHDESCYAADPQDDPAGPTNGSLRVLRGSSWYDYGHSCRSGHRNGLMPTLRDRRIGFRVVVTASPPSVDALDGAPAPPEP